MISWIRNHLYERGVLTPIKVSRPIVSVGNLTFGGTGKTPFVDLLLNFCEKNGIQAGVVSRGFGRSTKGVCEVKIQADQETIFGDEPSLLKTKHNSSNIFVGERRVEAAEALIAQYPQTQILFADDAFQHRALARELDVVLVDAARPIKDLQMFPLGRAREGLSGLVRANYLVLTRMDQASDVSRKQLLELLCRFTRRDVFENRIECHAHPLEFRKLGCREAVRVSSGNRIFAVSAIGSPAAFLSTLKSVAVDSTVQSAHFQDHHHYSNGDIAELQRRAADFDWIVTTEKDEIKIRNLTFDHKKWIVLPVVLQPSTSIERLYGQIRRLAISRV